MLLHHMVTQNAWISLLVDSDPKYLMDPNLASKSEYLERLERDFLKDPPYCKR